MQNIEVNLKVIGKEDNDTLGFKIKKGAVYDCSSNDMARFAVAIPDDALPDELPKKSGQICYFFATDLNKYFEVETKVYVPSFMLDDRALEEAYRAKHFQYVREDVSNVINSGTYDDLRDDYSDEEIETLIDDVAYAYAYKGDYDCDCSYWDNIDNLIDEYISMLPQEEETVEME